MGPLPNDHLSLANEATVAAAEIFPICSSICPLVLVSPPYELLISSLQKDDEKLLDKAFHNVATF